MKERKLTKLKVIFLGEKINKINKPFTRLIKKDKTINSIRNERIKEICSDNDKYLKNKTIL